MILLKIYVKTLSLIPPDYMVRTIYLIILFYVFFRLLYYVSPYAIKMTRDSKYASILFRSFRKLYFVLVIITLASFFILNFIFSFESDSFFFVCFALCMYFLGSGFKNVNNADLE